jgi:hypothetical protein
MHHEPQSAAQVLVVAVALSLQHRVLAGAVIAIVEVVLAFINQNHLPLPDATAGSV